MEEEKLQDKKLNNLTSKKKALVSTLFFYQNNITLLTGHSFLYDKYGETCHKESF